MQCAAPQAIAAHALRCTAWLEPGAADVRAAGAQICGSTICMLLVDSMGRRTLMVQGSVYCGAALVLIGLAGRPVLPAKHVE